MGNVLVPDFADWFAVDVLDRWGDLHRVTTAAIGHSFGTDPDDHPESDQLVRLAITEGRSQVVMNTDRIGSADIGAAVHPMAGTFGTRSDIDSMLVVPVKVRNDFAGAMSFVTGRGRRGYRPSDLRTANELADRVGVAIDRVVAWREAQVAGNAALGYAQRLQQLVEAGLVVNAQLAEEEVLELLAEHAHRVLAAEVVAITVGGENGPIPGRIWPPQALRSGSKHEQLVWELAAVASKAVAASGLSARQSASAFEPSVHASHTNTELLCNAFLAGRTDHRLGRRMQHCRRRAWREGPDIHGRRRVRAHAPCTDGISGPSERHALRRRPQQ